MSISAAIAYQLTVTETLSPTFADTNTSNRKVVTNGLNISKTLNAGSTPPGTMLSAFQKTLVSGGGQIDLRTLPGTTGTQDGNGLKLQACILYNPTTNANTITVAVGTSNGYTFAGAACSVTLSPGDTIALFRNDTAPDVDGTHKLLDIAGTGSQVLDVELVLG